MSKSDFKKLVATYASQCIEPEGGHANTIQSYPVVIQDLPCELSGLFGSLAKKEELYTLDDLVQRVFEPAVAAVSRGVKLWIAVQDKAQLVTVAKHPEWQKRARNKQTAAVPTHAIAMPKGKPNEVQTIVEMQASIPRQGQEWHTLFNHADRKNKNFLVRQFTQRAKALVPDMLRQRETPLENRVVLDCEQMPLIEQIEGNYIHKEPLPVIWPLRNSRLLTSDEQERATAYDERLQAELGNQLGEYDVCFVHHLQTEVVKELLTCPDEGVLLETVDTDILLIAALRMGELALPIRVKLGLPKGISLPGAESATGKYHFDPCKVRNWLCTALQSTGDQRPEQELMRSFCTVYVMGGSDFCHDSIPDTSTHKLLLQYLKEGGPAREFLKDKVEATVDVLSGRVNKSASARSIAQLDRGQRLQHGGLNEAVQLAEYIANDYWSYSGHKQQVVTMPIGHGIGLDGGALVFAAELV